VFKLVSVDNIVALLQGFQDYFFLAGSWWIVLKLFSV